MKTLSALAILFGLAVSAMAQSTTPDCQFSDTFTTASPGSSRANSNNGSPCVAWRVTYDAVNMTALSIQMEGAPWNAAGDGPGTFAAIPGSAISQGTNPLTDPENATLSVQGTVYYPWVRLNVTVYTPSGAGGDHIRARTYGYKGTTANLGVGGSSSVSVNGTPIPAPNFNDSTPPAQVGFNNASLQSSGNDVSIEVPNPMTDTGDMLDGGAGGALHRVPGNTTTTQKFLSQTGDGVNSADPSWQTVPSQGTLTYYHTNTASSIATYLQQTAGPYTPKTTLPFAALPTGTDTLKNWATNAGIPNLTFIPAGAYSCHLHALRTGGGTVNLRCQFVEVNAVGADIAVIGQSEDSAALGNAEIEYNLFFVDGNTYTMATAASRIVVRVQAVVSGSAPTVDLFVGGTADAHTSLPSSTVDATNFVPYVGATADLNMGTHAAVGWTDNGTTISAAAGRNVSIAPTLPVTIATTTPQSPTQTGFFFNNSAGAMTFNLPAITTGTVGNQYCFRNYVTRTGAITLDAPASTYIDKDGANGAASGTLVSGGAAGDSACVVATSTTQYVAYVGAGTWTNN